MRTVILLFALLVVTASCNKESLTKLDPLFISIDDVAFWEGDYTGTLTYLDYSSEKLVYLNTSTSIKVKGKKLKIKHQVDEGNGTTVSRKTTYSFKNGVIDGIVPSQKNIENESIYLVWEKEGKDNNQNATLQYILSTDTEQLTLTKMVKYDGTNEFFLRNEYNLKRS